MAVIGLFGTLGTLGAADYYSADLPSLDSIGAGNLAQASRIYDRNGTLIEELYNENRTVVSLSKISLNLQHATIATEDRQFYEHQGVDYRRMAIAGIYDLTHKGALQGGSTITQQVVKLDVLQDQSRAFDRKIKELMLSEELERRYSKQQILELYLNSIPYGNQAYGSEAAAETYFGKHASELDLAEASFLAGLPQSPVQYDPFGTPAQQASARARWREVLDSMVAARMISGSLADSTYAIDILKRVSGHRPATARDPRTAHFVDYIFDYLVNKYGVKNVYEGGLQITTSLDLTTQYSADASVKKGVADYKSKGANTGALLAMDPRDGEILAMVGSADFNNVDIRGQVNLTGVNPSGYRPVGSSFKPYTYGTAIESGALNAASKVDDQNDVINGHQYFDWDSRKEGQITLRQALAESRNLPALWTYRQMGGQKVVAFARKLGITTPIPNPDSIPTTLGTESMSMIEHLSAYSAFDNGGFKITPHPVLKVADKKGQVLESFDRQASKERVITPDVAYLMTDLLRGPPKLALGMSGAQPIAAKSGTTESWTGAYWIGYTPDLAVGTYMAHINAGDQCTSGFAKLAQGFSPSGWLCPTNVLWGEHVGSSVWEPFLLGYYKSHPWPAAWTMPPGVVTMAVCKDGNLAADNIPADQKKSEIFIKNGGLPNASCAPPAPPPTPAPAPAPSPSVAPSRSPSPSPSPHS